MFRVEYQSPLSGTYLRDVVCCLTKFVVVILADDLLLSFKGIQFTVIFDGKVLLNETLSGKTGTRLSSEGADPGGGGTPLYEVYKYVPPKGYGF